MFHFKDMGAAFYQPGRLYATTKTHMKFPG